MAATLLALQSLKTAAQVPDQIIVDHDSLVNFAKSQLGTRYHYAHCAPENGFDCSGYVYYVFSHFRVKVPRSSSEYARFGTTVPLDSSKTGDVIVFTGTKAGSTTPGHVGIILEGGSHPRFIHSSSDKRTPGVKISDFEASPNYRRRFIKVVRVCRVIGFEDQKPD